MNKCSTLIVSFSVLIFITSAQAGVILTHTGSNDPFSEGWSIYHGTSVGVATGPTNDNGTAAWYVDDNATGNLGLHQYVQYLDDADVTDGIINGWSMDVSVRVVNTPDTVDPAVWAAVLYNNQYYAMAFGSQSDGDPIVSVGYSQHAPSPQYTLEGSGGGYHDYSLIYDPSSQTVDLFVDGAEVISDVAGRYHSNSDDVVMWGSGTSPYVGHGNYSALTFAIPEPGTLGLIGLFAGGIILVRRFFVR